MAITMVTTTMPLIDGSPLAGVREQRKRLLALMAADLVLDRTYESTRPSPSRTVKKDPEEIIVQGRCSRHGGYWRTLYAH